MVVAQVTSPVLRAESLGITLLAAVSADAKREAQRIFQASEQRAGFNRLPLRSRTSSACQAASAR